MWPWWIYNDYLVANIDWDADSYAGEFSSARASVLDHGPVTALWMVLGLTSAPVVAKMPLVNTRMQ